MHNFLLCQYDTIRYDALGTMLVLCRYYVGNMYCIETVNTQLYTARIMYKRYVTEAIIQNWFKHVCKG